MNEVGRMQTGSMKLAPGVRGGGWWRGATWFKGLLPGWNVKIATDEGLLFIHTSAEHLDILRTQKSSPNLDTYL